MSKKIINRNKSNDKKTRNKLISKDFSHIYGLFLFKKNNKNSSKNDKINKQYIINKK